MNIIETIKQFFRNLRLWVLDKENISSDIVFYLIMFITI